MTYEVDNVLDNDYAKRLRVRWWHYFIYAWHWSVAGALWRN